LGGYLEGAAGEDRPNLPAAAAAAAEGEEEVA
jgi:hypothetical protein